MILSAGFGEIEAGRELEAALGEAALEHGLPVCGPNGNGIVAARGARGDVGRLGRSARARLGRDGHAERQRRRQRAWPARGIRWHTVVSTGNQTGLRRQRLARRAAGLPEVRSVAPFPEADGDGARLAEALALCAERDVGVWP